MLTGRFQLAAPGEKLPTKTAVVLGFGAARRRRRPTPPRWTARRRLAAGRRRAAPRSATATRPRWARSTCCPAGVDRPVPGLGETEQGPDADDPALTLEVWRERIRRHPGELKNLLRNQAFVAGIGNAYSDEILHAARLLPFRKRSTWPPRRSTRCTTATRATLADAIEVLRERVPPTFEKQVRDFLAVHDKGGQAVSALRDPDHRGQGRRLHHVVLPGLPALSAGSESRAARGPGPTRSARRVVDAR